MASKDDTLKVAQADVDTIRSKLSSARLGHGFMRNQRGDVKGAISLLEKTSHRLRKAFRLEEEEEWTVTSQTR